MYSSSVFFLHAYSGKDFFFWQVNAKQNMAWTFQCREAVHTGNLAKQPQITQTVVQAVRDFRSKTV